MIQWKEIYKFKTGGDRQSHKGSTRGINELNFPSVLKGDLIGCSEIWTSRSPAQGSLGNQGDSIISIVGFHMTSLNSNFN